MSERRFRVTAEIDVYVTCSDETDVATVAADWLYLALTKRFVKPVVDVREVVDLGKDGTQC